MGADAPPPAPPGLVAGLPRRRLAWPASGTAGLACQPPACRRRLLLVVRRERKRDMEGEREGEKLRERESCKLERGRERFLIRERE